MKYFYTTIPLHLYGVCRQCGYYTIQGGGGGEECACATVLNSCIYLYKVSFYSNTKGAELHLTVMSPNMLIHDDEVRDQKDHSMI